MINFIRVIAGLALATSACIANAAPVTTDDEGYRTEEVKVSISESDPKVFVDPQDADLLAIQLRIDFADDDLKFISAIVNSSNPAFSTSFFIAEYFEFDVNGNPVVFPELLIASLSAPLPSDGSAIGSFHLELTFQILEGAGTGPTFVRFACDPSGLAQCPDNNIYPASATVIVLDRTPIPLPGTLPLLGLGVAALLWTRRRIA